MHSLLVFSDRGQFYPCSRLSHPLFVPVSKAGLRVVCCTRRCIEPKCLYALKTTERVVQVLLFILYPYAYHLIYYGVNRSTVKRYQYSSTRTRTMVLSLLMEDNRKEKKVENACYNFNVFFTGHVDSFRTQVQVLPVVLL
jgi:hypothetical protein